MVVINHDGYMDLPFSVAVYLWIPVPCGGGVAVAFMPCFGEAKWK